MKNSTFSFRLSLITAVLLLLSVGLFAQRGRGHQNNYYKHYRHYPQSYVTVNVRPRYSYRPYYRPVTVYRPVYSSPLAYVHFGPSFGFRLNVLPFGYSRFYFESIPYYYNQGVYYRSYGNGYEVVAPPLGASVDHLPANATVTVIDGQKYYQLGGTFYLEEISENNKLSYRVVGTDAVLNTGNPGVDDANTEINDVPPAIGSRYDELPADCKVMVINQHKYFVSTAGIYYQEVIEGDKIRYEVTTVQ